MEYFIYKLYNDREIANVKVKELNSQVSGLESTIDNLQGTINNISDTINKSNENIETKSNLSYIANVYNINVDDSKEQENIEFHISNYNGNCVISYCD